MRKLYLKDQHMHFGFTNIILLHSDHRHHFGYSRSRMLSDDISLPILLLTKLVHISPHVPSVYITHKITLQTIFKFQYFVLVTALPSNRNCNHNYMILNCGVTLTYNKHVYTLALTMLKMAT